MKDLQIILNKVPPGTDSELLRMQVEKVFGAQVTGLLPLNNEMAKLGSSGIFATRFPDHPMTWGLKHVADQLLA